MNPDQIKDVLDHLTTIPVGLLYLILGSLSAIENVFPPLPTDLFVAFGSFIAARGHGNPWISFLFCFTGNMIGAGFTFFLGRRYGPGILTNPRFQKMGGNKAGERIARLYDKYGVAALFISRFLPGVRALVPPVAGALSLNPVTSCMSFGLASALWYAFVTVVAFRAGDNFDLLYGRIVKSGKIVSFGASALVLVAVAIWLIRRYIRDEIKTETVD